MSESPDTPVDPVAANDAKARPEITSFYGLSQRPNIWTYSGKDKNGKLIEFAPGMTKATATGPTKPADVLRNAKIHLYNARMEAVRNGYADPGYVVDEESIKPVGVASIGTVDEMISWKPEGGVPVTIGVGLTMPTPEAQKAHDDAMVKFLADQEA
jgi:hypothetical protein